MAANVDIELSDDGGLSYPYTLVSNTANDGSEYIIIPGINTSTARLRVRSSGAGHFFFDISNANFQISGTLATGLGALRAQYEGGAVALQWELERQPGMERLVMERMLNDGPAFTDLADIDLQEVEQSSYVWRDNTVQAGITYAYRLGWLDAEGKRSYSNTVEVGVPLEGFSPTLYPNPVQHALSIQGCSDGVHQLRITTPAGRLVWRGATEGTASSLDLDELEAGMYFVELIDVALGRFSYKIVKN